MFNKIITRPPTELKFAGYNNLHILYPHSHFGSTSFKNKKVIDVQIFIFSNFSMFNKIITRLPTELKFSDNKDILILYPHNHI